MVGGGRPRDLDRGWFVEPTVFADVDNSSTIAQEEIFGPVLSVIPYADVDDAIRIANDTDYGLGGSVWTADAERGKDVARRIRTGTIGINKYLPEPPRRSAASRRAASAASSDPAPSAPTSSSSRSTSNPNPAPRLPPPPASPPPRLPPALSAVSGAITPITAGKAGGRANEDAGPAG